MPEIDRYFDMLMKRGGSDLHIAAQYPPMIRSKGELIPLTIEKDILSPERVETLLYELLSPEQRKTFDTNWDLDFAYGYEDKARFRGNYMRKTVGMGAVFRIIPTKILTLDQLGVPLGIRKLADLKAGLVLVTGPTGSGKSTTLAAMVNQINATRQAHILTIEDPVEFVHHPINCQITHREVGEDTPSFLEAIRSAVRENADVILVGELRGAETMKLALQLASFGCLVFATVHTNSAPATIDRFVNAFAANEQPQIRGMLADALAGIVAQQLLKKADGSGRIPAHEILIATPALTPMIRESKTAQIPSFIQAGISDHMQTMDGTLSKLVKEGLITAHDGLEKALDKEYFMKMHPEVADATADAAAGH
ncbi:MAG: PilT/PilU family type 4a pilus ATPase [Myxococcales bacterium]|nr:PilT/PilU family type 4a pilus ATPase [Myxococcales bacterium]